MAHLKNKETNVLHREMGMKIGNKSRNSNRIRNGRK